MKTALFKSGQLAPWDARHRNRAGCGRGSPTRRVPGPTARARQPWGALLAVAALLTATAAQAQGTVDTLGGGPFQGSSPDHGFVNGDTALFAKFYTPSGLALDSTGNYLFVADRDNNAIRRLNLGANLTETFVTGGISKPVAVALDSLDNVYVVNQGTGANGTLLKFDRFKNFVGTLASGLVNATAVALDGSANAYATANGNTVVRIGPAGSNVVGVITTPGTFLRGLVVLDSGMLALSDSGNNGIWLLNPDNGTKTAFTGFNGAGDVLGPPAFAKFSQPYLLAKAGGGRLVVADRGNHRVKVVDASGAVSHLYGVAASDWVPGWSWPGWYDGEACDNGFGACAEAREPVGLAVAANGTVYSTEVYYHVLRKLTGSGLSGPGTGGGGGADGTNVVITPPTLSPNAGYFPRGQFITVGSPNPEVFYTTDGTLPTTNSLRVPMIGNSGTIRWSSASRDLTSLRVQVVVGTNASVVVSGQPSPTNSIGVPTGWNPQLYAGVGSTITVPVVVNLRTNDWVRSLQFRVEVTPEGDNTNSISAQFRTLSILSNDFVVVTTPAQGATSAVYSATAYTLPAGGGRLTRGLAVSAIGTNANVVFSNYAVVAMLAVPIPATAREGQAYTVKVLEASATSDGLQTSVSLPSMNNAVIVVTNVSYTVGDSAPGSWYNAGEFGDGNLNNADVNNAFYASLGLRVPHSFSDAHDAMDTFPADGPGFVGGDGLIRYLDWQLVLQRSLRLNTNNWKRMWNAGGVRTNRGPFTLTAFGSGPDFTFGTEAWYRQALVGAVPVGHVPLNTRVDVPVYVKTVAGASLSGLQFRVSVTPDGAAPALSQPPEFVAAPGVNPPGSVASLAEEIACGWSLGAVNFGSQSSNLLGHVRFTVPYYAVAGQTYTVRFSHADGAPNITTAYTLETRSAQVSVLSPTGSAPISSEEWRAYYFASANDPAANDFADADADGSPNWQEFLAGTDPLNHDSKLEFAPAETQVNGGQKQIVLRWRTAPGRVYEVLQSGSPTSPSWGLRRTFAGDGNEAEFVETDTRGVPRFYRLRVQP